MGIGVFARWEAQYTMEAPASGKQQAGSEGKGKKGAALSPRLKRLFVRGGAIDEASTVGFQL